MPVARRKRSGKGKGAAQGNVPSGQQSRVKLIEIGPRLTLELFRVEAGLCAGDVLYHRYVTKSAQEARALKERVESEREGKKRRREEQEINVARKREMAEAKRERKRARREEMKKRGEEGVRGLLERVGSKGTHYKEQEQSTEENGRKEREADSEDDEDGNYADADNENDDGDDNDGY